MDGKKVGLSIMLVIFRLILVSLVILFIIKGAQTAYSYGYRLFAQETMTTPENARTVSVTVSATDSVKDVATQLQERGLIEDALLFRLQERISDSHGKIHPGTYELNTAMTPEEMIKRMAADEPTEADSPPAASANINAQGEEDESWEGEEGSMGEEGGMGEEVSPEEETADGMSMGEGEADTEGD